MQAGWDTVRFLPGNPVQWEIIWKVSCNTWGKRDIRDWDELEEHNPKSSSSLKLPLSLSLFQFFDTSTASYRSCANIPTHLTFRIWWHDALTGQDQNLHKSPFRETTISDISISFSAACAYHRFQFWRQFQVSPLWLGTSEVEYGCYIN